MSETCKKLHEVFSALPRLRTGYKNSQVPANGIYIVFEKGEKAHGTDRIVGVGTHTGEGNLSQRLNEHLYTPNKDRSILRKHVGRCLLVAEKIRSSNSGIKIPPAKPTVRNTASI